MAPDDVKPAKPPARPKKSPPKKGAKKSRGKKSKPIALAELPGLADPRAPLDSATFLKAAQPALKALDADLLARAKASPALTTALRARHAEDKANKRTADAYAQWLERFIAQVGAAWLLSCVFVRTLEDRGLLGRNRIAGPGAADAQRLFFQMAPSLTERDYLLTVFAELSHYPAARALFDARHNPVCLLAPSADAAKALLALFRTPSADEPAFRFGQASTRFLGDLYQDLDESVRKRYALLQTPDFVEAFILDRTLEPAIEKFGLEDTDLIDPTCGSGHFLLGAFDRLFDHTLRAKPGLSPRQAAAEALDKVYGADINPYAAAIAKFRLTLSFLDKAGFDQIADAPKLPLHVAVADSLLYNPQHEQSALFEQEGADVVDWEKRAFELEDEEEAREVLGRTYAAVVGNPPYITVKDKALRDRYRELYPSAQRQYALTVPFCERFFQLARKGGRTGQITANSFMKREFGKGMVQDFLPRVNLDLIANTSGAYIPGHGTPTVLLFGSNEEPVGNDVLTVLAKRGEPSTPADPAKGLVWSSVTLHFSDVGYEDDYVSVAMVPRDSLEEHPWSLAGGGAGELKALLEARATAKLEDLVAAMGRVAHTGADEAYVASRSALARAGLLDSQIVDFVEGQAVRDWSLGDTTSAVFPYEHTEFQPEMMEENRADPRLKYLWPYREMLWMRREPNGNHREIGKTWFEFSRFHPERFVGPCITFAEVATHNHFVLDRGGKVFKQTAPIIKLPPDATEDDHLALLAYLNSSTACFWMKQVCHNKSNASQKHHQDPACAAYQFSGTALLSFPLPEFDPSLVTCSRSLAERASERGQWLSGDALRKWLRSTFVGGLSDFIEAGWDQYDRTTAECVYLQEEIDWAIYSAFGLADAATAPDAVSAIALGERPFEHAGGYDAGVSEAASGETRARAHFDDAPAHWSDRADQTANSAELRTLEERVFKRMWRDTERNVDQEAFRLDVVREWLTNHVQDLTEAAVQSIPVTPSDAAKAIPQATLTEIAAFLEVEGARLVRDALADQAIPFLAAHCFTESGMTKRHGWLQTWELQAAEDRGESPGAIEVPPAYSNGSRGKSKDFRSPTFWRLRGKLDVPKERFISYPGCESDQDGEPIYGWAGWNHEQRAKALATLYWNRKNEEGWDKDRLTPMLAGLEELLFWLHLWHHEKSDAYAGDTPANYYQGFLNAECATHGLTIADLKAWRPPAKAKRKKKAKKKPPAGGEA